MNFRILRNLHFTSVQSLSRVWLVVIPWTRPPCPSPTPRVHPNSCSLNRWCHPTILSSVVPSPPALNLSPSGSFQMSQFFTSGGQRIGVSASASVPPMNTQDWFPLRWTGWISFSVVPFSSRFQTFPASGSFPVSSFFTSGGESIGVSASALVLPMNIQDWFHLGFTGWLSLQSKSLLQHHSSKAWTLSRSAYFIDQLTSIHDYWKNHSLD